LNFNFKIALTAYNQSYYIVECRRTESVINKRWQYVMHPLFNSLCGLNFSTQP